MVSLHCNLDEKTTHLMNEERLNMMKKDAILINASRGPVIDEVALVNHLKANPDYRCAASWLHEARAVMQSIDKPGSDLKCLAVMMV